MSSTKSFINTFMLAIATLAITSCVPKATEKKAACGVNQAFSSVSRSCYSILEGRTKPVGTTATVAMDEEISKTITLAYTDGNKDKAVSCKVTPTSTSLELIAPSVADGGLFKKADAVYLNASNIANVLGGALLVSDVAMRKALDKAKASQYYPTVAAQLVVFKTQATSIITSAMGITNNVVVLSNYMAGQENLLAFTPMMTNMSNRCECSGGVCSTLAIPKANKTGIAGFFYTVTDIDGEGSAKATAVTITAMSKATTAHLRPVAQSGFYDLYESSTSAATAYNITIPEAADVTGVNAGMKYYFDTSYPLIATKSGNIGRTAKGMISGCMDLAFSDGPKDRTCVYTPTNPDGITPNGNLFDSITPVKAVTPLVGNLRFTAVAEGTAGNSFTVQFFDLRDKNLLTNNLYANDPYVTGPQIYGLVSGAEEAFIRVAGNAIKIFINPAETTETQIQDLINNHKQASLLVRASGGTSGAPAVTPTPVALAGGVDAYDKIPFYVNNLITNSVNKSFLSFKIHEVDDVPEFNSVAGGASFFEDPTPAVMEVDLSATYTDSDTNATSPGPGYYNICNIDPLDAIFLFNFDVVDCTCVLNVCKAHIDPKLDVSSTTAYSFRYRIGSVDTIAGVTKYTDYKTFSLEMKPINDEPILSTNPLPVGYNTLPTITAIPAQVMQEDTSRSIDVYIGPGGSGFETAQQLTLALTVTSNNQTLLPDANITVSVIGPVLDGKRRITFTPAADQSGTATLSIKLKDKGDVLNVGDDDTYNATVSLTVTPVNDPPVFKSSFTKIETNEGGAVQSDGFQVDEDTANTGDENAQSITIDSLVSDNHNVLPDNAIKIFYDLNDNGVEDVGEARNVGDVVEISPATDAYKHKFYLKLDPVDGIAGNANVIMTISDHILPGDPLLVANPATYTPISNTGITKTFSFIVHPIAALHGGWTNIASTGIKTDKTGTPVTPAEIQCNYNKRLPLAGETRPGDVKNCGGVDCTGETSPTGTIVPDDENVLYWDSKANRCYRSTSSSQFSWVDFNTSCPVSRTTNPADYCSGNNCISDLTAPYPLNTEIPTAVGQYYYNTSTNTCYVSTGKEAITQWQTFIPAKVTLSWKPFIMVGSGGNSSVQIEGWNVYRREAMTDYNFKGGHLINTSSDSTFTIKDPSIRTFTDTTAIAGKIYYYVVRPVDNIRKFPTYTPEMFSEVRVVAAPENYSFVHRWMINQEVCNSMNITTTTTPSHVDQTKNFRCEYQGPGESATYPGYYDYGKDILVDTQELGCAYAPAPKCSANGCVGAGAPTITADLVTDDLYYDRSTGTCSRFDSVTSTFAEMNSAFTITSALATSMKSALNAPLVNIGQARAVDICAARASPFFYRKDNVTLAASLSVKAILPNKKDYIAYSSQRLDMTDPEVTEMEQGYSLNIQSRCNGSAASGLEIAYTDSTIPSTSFMHSLPGTFSSNIRSLYTGSISGSISKGTSACVSRYGIQDLYGNVAEWTSDRLNCAFDYEPDPIGAPGVKALNHVCTSTGTGAIYEYAFNGKKYGFDNVTGPYNDSEAGAGLDGPSPLDADLTSWIFGDTFFTATKFSLPVGLPISSNIVSDGTTKFSAAIPYLLDIGPSSGITSNRLHEDGMIPNVTSVRNNGGVGGFAVGGSYLSGNKAGRYTSELIPVAFKRPDVGMRCIIPVMNYTTGDTQYTYPY